MKNNANYIMLLIKGIGIGAANVIPGVSGGTIALLTGIYEDLIFSIKSFNLKNLSLLLKGKFKDFAKATNLYFLISVLVGVVISTFSLAKILLYLLNNHPIATWSFFFGLVLISCWIILSEIKNWNFATIFSTLIGIGIATYISLASPAETPDSEWFIFLCGAIAICAMILPGISGSFILVLLVKYEYIMNAISSLNIPILTIFVLGAAFGLIAFSHLLSWLLKRYYYQTMALLTGFMIGSLIKIWPWQKIIAGQADKAISFPILPTTYQNIMGTSPQIGAAIIFCLIGIALVYIIEKVAKTN